MCAHGVLTQWLAAFTSHGNPDPRTETAATLQAQGVSLERHLQTVATPQLRKRWGGARAKILYMNACLKADCDNGIVRSKLEIDAAKRDYCKKFDEQPEQDKQTWERKVAECNSERARNCGLGGDAVEVQNSDRNPELLCGLASKDLPLDFDTWCEAIFDGRQYNPECSFRSWGPSLRQEFCDSVFVRDVGAIPANVKISIPLSCSQEHVGLCRERDADNIELYLNAGQLLWSSMYRNKLEFSWVRLHVADRAEPEVVFHTCMVHAFCSHVRGSNPAVSLFILADYMAGGRIQLSLPITTYTDAMLVRHVLSRPCDEPVLCPGRCLVYQKISTRIMFAAPSISQHAFVSFGDPVIFMECLCDEVYCLPISCNMSCLQSSCR
jgi:hypothetical protein